MSDEPSFEQLSVSSNDSWALVDVGDAEDVAAHDINLSVFDQPDKDYCLICNEPLSTICFPSPSCVHCLICAFCRETFDPQSIPACRHVRQDAEVSVFSFDDSTEENAVISNPNECCSFEPVPSTSCHSEPDYAPTASELLESSPAASDPNILNDRPQTETAESPQHRDWKHESLSEYVQKALQLNVADVEATDVSVESQLETKNCTFENSQSSLNPDQIKLILSPNLWPQSGSVSSNLSSASNSGCFPTPRLSALPPVICPSIKVIRSSCNSSECRTSSSSSSSISPPSLSASPMNTASRIFKSVVTHSASAMNHFDCMPMDAFDANPITPKRTESKPCPKLKPGSPKFTLPEGDDDRLVNERNFIKRTVWDHEKMHSMLKSKPIFNSVLEQSAYNLR